VPITRSNLLKLCHSHDLKECCYLNESITLTNNGRTHWECEIGSAQKPQKEVTSVSNTDNTTHYLVIIEPNTSLVPVFIYEINVHVAIGVLFVKSFIYIHSPKMKTLHVYNGI